MHIEKDIFYNTGQDEDTKYKDPLFQFILEEGLYDMKLSFRSYSTLQGDSVDVKVIKESGEEFQICTRKRFQERHLNIPFQIVIKERQEKVQVEYKIHRSIYYLTDPVAGRVKLTAKEVF